MNRPDERWAQTASDVTLALAIRRRVFVEEQGIPAALDDDGLDDHAQHLLVEFAGAVAATGRLQVDGRLAKLSRIAVEPSQRGTGIGSFVVAALEHRAMALGCRQATLHPHMYLEGFYRSLGYEVVEGSEIVAGTHRLIEMIKDLEPTHRPKVEITAQ